jgi:hypothetical protein
LVYGVLYVVFEMVRHQLEQVGWERVTPLEVAAALVDALLAIVLTIAAVVAFDVGRRRWGPVLRSWQERQLLRAAASAATDGEPITVASWRPHDAGPLSIEVASRSGEPISATSTYGARTTGYSRRFTEDPGRQL